MAGSARVAFLLGKPPRSSSMFPEVFERLRDRGIDVRVHLPHETDEPLPGWLGAVDLVVHRGLDERALDAVQSLSEAGVACHNPVAATRAVGDRLHVRALLAGAGLPVPVTRLAGTWDEVVEAAASPVVVKVSAGQVGRGAHVVVGERATLPPRQPFPGPYVVQAYVANDGFDRKAYVAGPHVRGLRKPSPLHHGHTQGGVALVLDERLVDQARAAGEALGLGIYGVDFVMGADGPTIVDVNPFPGFKGVPDAAELVAGHLASLVGR